METAKPKSCFNLYVIRPFLPLYQSHLNGLQSPTICPFGKIYLKSEIVFLFSLGSKMGVTDGREYLFCFVYPVPSWVTYINKLRQHSHYFISLSKMGLQRLNLLRLFVYTNQMYKMGMEPTLGAHIDFDKT